MPVLSRLKFLEKFSANNFALSDAEDNTSGPLNRGGITDLPLSGTLLKKKLYGPFLWIGFNCLKARATSRRHFTFYH